MRVGIFGGSFNPPHLGHLIIAEVMRESFSLEQILWIPSAEPPHKKPTDLAPAHHRFEMVRIAISNNDAFVVSEIELEREGPSFTIDTITELKAERSSDEFFLIIGGDSLADFPRWRQPDRIVSEVPLLVYERHGYPSETDLPSHRVMRADVPLIEISSTEIRRRYGNRETVRYLLPDAVDDYVRRHGLYQT